MFCWFGIHSYIHSIHTYIHSYRPTVQGVCAWVGALVWWGVFLRVCSFSICSYFYAFCLGAVEKILSKCVCLLFVVGAFPRYHFQSRNAKNVRNVGIEHSFPEVLLLWRCIRLGSVFFTSSIIHIYMYLCFVCTGVGCVGRCGSVLNRHF